MFPDRDADTGGPRVFYVPPGADFPSAVVRGLEERIGESDPAVWARVRLVANSGRMLARLHDEFEARPPRLLPQMRLMTDIDGLAPDTLLSPNEPLHPLRIKLDLARLLLNAPGLSNRATAFDMAGSLAALFAEMDEEGVSAEVLASLDVEKHSAHWGRALDFVQIAAGYAAAQGLGQQRARAFEVMAHWVASPPNDPLLAIGSTGSRGTTAELLKAIAGLPQGAVILPGFDPNTPQNVWDGLLRRAEEDHPQYRYAVLLDALDLDPQTLPSWSATPAPSAQRNRIISLALRPAPVTDQWLQDGPSLGPLPDGLTDVTLIEARDGRQEANAIALRLRQAAEAGETAALISPDRTLTRRVSAALDRWHIVPDDAAGIPLSLTAPGRLLRQLAALGRHGIASDTLIALLKHPLVSSGEGRGPHLLFTRALELHLRRRGPPFPKLSDIETWTEQDDTRADWGAWLGRAMDVKDWANLPEFLNWLRQTAELLAAGPGATGSGALWDEAPGRAAKALMEELAEVASDDDALGTVDPLTLLNTAMAAIPMNIQNVTHPGIMIWGTLDARAQGASLVILGGLNEGSWPQQSPPDPWLNRDMRRTAGLRSPERQVGLSAHDFQQAIGAGEVWLTRATKSDDAETVPSRWLNRITTMLQGLPDQDGPAALAAMRARGEAWLSYAGRLDLAARVDPAPRPAPIPPVAVRPKKLSVTEIKTLIRDPYAIYARHILRLRELDPLVGEPDALLRGTVLHKVMEDVVRVGLPDDLGEGLALISETAARVLERDVSWKAARAMWQARVMRAAPWFISTERTRAAGVTQTALETKGALSLPSRDFTLTGEADRIDLTSDGRARIFDYKTGTPPSDKQQRAFDKQLLLEALMAERGAFDALGPVPVERAAYIGLGTTPSERDAPLGESEVWAEFETLIARMQAPDHGFTARRAMEREADKSPYDLLSRHGEWSSADAAVKIRL